MEKLPTIEVITMTINEEFLLQFFLNHYSFANHIRIFDDIETRDNTKELVAKYPNATLECIEFPDGFDNDIAVAKLNQCYAESKYDWVIAVDVDEFVFHEGLIDTLKTGQADIYYVRLYQVYRNYFDVDLDPNLPIREQRRCGDAEAVKGNNKKGAKPIVVRTGMRRMKWMPGQHNIWNRHRHVTSDIVLLGAHWMYADPCFAVERRLRGKERQSQQNIIRGNSSHYNTITADQVSLELEDHKFDRRLF